jgi:transposase
MRRVIGMDIHRTFAEVVFWEDGKLRPAGRVSMTRAGLEVFGRSLGKEDEVVIEATGNAMAVVRVLSPYVRRVIVANPLQVKAIAHAHVKTDKIDAGVLASLRPAGFLPEIWLPDADTERRRRLVARRNQVVRHRTRIKNEVHAILHAHLVPPCPQPSCSGDWAGSGCPDSSSPMTRPPLSNGTCANSIGSARIWLVSTVRLRRRRSTIRRSSDC